MTTEAQDEELFLRQVLAAMGASVNANLANALSAFVLALYVVPTRHIALALTWLGLALTASAIRPAVWWVRRRRLPVHESGIEARRYFRITAAELVTQWALTTTFFIIALPRVDSGRQMVLVATMAGIIGGGAIALSTLRPIAILWVVCHVIGVMPSLLAMRQNAFYLLTVQLVVFGGFLVLAVIHLEDSFNRRSIAEFRALESQHDVELLLDDFEDGARDWLWETGEGGTFTRTSERLAEVSGRQPTDLRALTLTELLSELAHAQPGGPESVQELSRVLARGEMIRDHLVPVRVAGQERWWTLSAKPVTNREGVVVGWRGVGIDTTELYIHQRELTTLAHTDPLTGLANRRAFHDVLESRLTAEERTSSMHLAIFDVDNFKAVNDTLGHGVGDELLVQVASRLRVQKGDDFIARLGGDEFAVVVQPEHDVTYVEEHFARYRNALTEPFSVRGNRIEISASAGCATAHPGRGMEAEEMVRMADLALYDAKGLGQGRLSAFTTSMSVRARNRSTLLADLARAIDNDEFLFYYQGQRDARTGRVVANEALLRWQHPTRGLLPPSAFLEVATESGLMVPIGELMLRRACQDLASSGRSMRTAVNVSQLELNGAGFMDIVERTLGAFDVRPELLELEVTESAALTERAISLLHELRELGVRIAIDDFGTGYSSLSSLQRLPADVLKIDRAFTSALLASDARSRRAAHAIMTSAVEIAQSLGMSTLAEGVENQAQLRHVREIGFDFVQGFYIAPPAPAVDRHLSVVETFSADEGSIDTTS